MAGFEKIECPLEREEMQGRVGVGGGVLPDVFMKVNFLSNITSSSSTSRLCHQLNLVCMGTEKLIFYFMYNAVVYIDFFYSLYVIYA